MDTNTVKQNSSSAGDNRPDDRRPGVGIVGAGNISGIYLQNLTTIFSDRVRLLGCADMVPERAEHAAKTWQLPRTYATVEDLLKDEDVGIVVNLTIPPSHYEVSLRAVQAGKHVYVEKPVCIELSEAEHLLAEAARRGVHLAGAPDTFLGGGIQTCRKVIDDGWIGRPVAAAAFMTNHGHESWHPDPAFYYKRGGGPMFDMGPYYLTALVNLIGGVKYVTGTTRVTFPQRTITSEPRRGTTIDVEVPTHVTGTLEFDGGAVATLIMSFDLWAASLPHIEIYGTAGTLSVPDPNTFGGPVTLKRPGDEEWHELPLTHAYRENSRGLGVADLADAIREDRPPRADGTMTAHVLEVMHGIHVAADSGTRYAVTRAVDRPAPLPFAW